MSILTLVRNDFKDGDGSAGDCVHDYVHLRSKHWIEWADGDDNSERRYCLVDTYYCRKCLLMEHAMVDEVVKTIEPLPIWWPETRR